jgi:hypothetical protein
MATTATNKLPLLIDRPLMRVSSLQSTSSPLNTSDPGSGSQGTLLVDCTANEGALLEDIYLIQRVAGHQSIVNLYLSSSNVALAVTATGGAAESFLLTQIAQPLGLPVGATVSFILPGILAPVPHAAGMMDGVPQFNGLRIERGFALWAANDAPDTDADAPNIAVQGGFH